MNTLTNVSIDQLLSRVIGYAAIYIQSGDERFLKQVEQAKTEIVQRVNVKVLP